MKNLSRIMAGGVGLLALGVPFVFAQAAASITIASLAPGDTVMATRNITFHVVPTGFAPQLYQVSDSFSGSTATNDSFAGAGNFSWVPIPSDVGTHTLTISARDVVSGEAATATQTITITPLPSLSIQSLSPGQTVMSGSKVSFTVSAPGFTTPRFTLRDSFGATTIESANIDASGNFSWTPNIGQNGDHTIIIYASDPAGHNAEITQQIRVGAGPTIAIQPPPAASVAPGTAVTFVVSAMNFAPTAFSVADTFHGTTVTNANISAAGAFSWAPQALDVGTHMITIMGIVGAYGQSATTTQTITVLGPGGTLPPPPALVTASTSTGLPPASSLIANASTGADSGIAALLAQIAILQAKINAQSSTTTLPIATGASSSSAPQYVFKKFIGLGYHGTDVIKLQERLIALGLLSSEATGYFGPATQAAVKQFQIAHGLDAKGYVGPGTRTALNQ